MLSEFSFSNRDPNSYYMTKISKDLIACISLEGQSLWNDSLKQINNIYTHKVYIWYVCVYIYLHQACLYWHISEYIHYKLIW